MSQKEYEKVAKEISGQLLHPPKVPLVVDEANPYLSYLTHRLNEVTSIYEKYDLYPTEIIVMGGRSLLNEFKTLTIFDYPLSDHSKESIIISYIENPLATVLYDDGFDGGTFSLEILLNHPISVWIPPAFGIAYSSVVTQDHYTSRWVLQINDGYEHETAEEIIPLL